MVSQGLKIACIRFLNFEQKEGLQKLAEACIRFTPKIAIRPKEAIFLDLTQSFHLFSEQSLRARIAVLAKRLGVKVHLTLGSHACISLAQSYFPDFERTGSFSNLPMEACVHFLDPFELNDDERKKAFFLAKTLKLLGVHTLEQFIKLPSKSLSSRFGETALRIHSFATGKEQPPWKGFTPSVTIKESSDLEFEELEVNLDGLLFTLKLLTDRALTRLVGLGQRASSVLITLQMVPWSSEPKPKRRWMVSLPIAQGTSLGLLPILRERLSYELSKEPIIAPVRTLEFEISETVLGHGSQRDFFHTKEVESESWDQLLGRLLSQFGQNDSNVFYAASRESYCPEQSWARTRNLSPFTFLDTASLTPFKRPSRILKTPELIEVKPGQILHLKTGKLWKVQFWEGPERISTDWWKETSDSIVFRDYYRITTFGNEKLWVFFDRRASGCFLHGYFD